MLWPKAGKYVFLAMLFALQTHASLNKSASMLEFEG